LLPEDYDPRVDVVPQERHMERVRGRLSTIAAEVTAMPTVEAFVAVQPRQAAQAS
jgi:hypothetical protein